MSRASSGKGQGKSGRTESRREARDRPGRPVRRAHGKEDAAAWRWFLHVLMVVGVCYSCFLLL